MAALIRRADAAPVSMVIFWLVRSSGVGSSAGLSRLSRWERSALGDTRSAARGRQLSVPPGNVATDVAR